MQLFSILQDTHESQPYVRSCHQIITAKQARAIRPEGKVPIAIKPIANIVYSASPKSRPKIMHGWDEPSSSSQPKANAITDAANEGISGQMIQIMMSPYPILLVRRFILRCAYSAERAGMS